MHDALHWIGLLSHVYASLVPSVPRAEMLTEEE